MCHSALQERYVNFYTDFAFKKLFGTEANKDLLISFLNSLFDGTEVIKTLNYLNVEHLGHNAAERRRTRQTLWRAVQMLTQKLSCQTIHDCPKVVPLHYESEWQ